MIDILTRLTDALSDRYQVERELGQGGMATVCLAGELRLLRSRVETRVVLHWLDGVTGH